MALKQKVKKIMKSVVGNVAPMFSKSSTMTIATAGEILESTSPRPVGTCVGDNKRVLDSDKGEAPYDLQIIIPTYNVEGFITSCLDSVVSNMKQSNHHVLATVINDGSTDETGDILRRYISDFNRTRVLNRGGYQQSIELIEQENRGLSGARNAALKHMKGNYITFLDSDDMLSEGAVDAWLDEAYKNNFDIVQGAWEEFLDDSGGKTVKKAPNHISGFPWGKVFKAAVLQHFQFPEGYWFEDTPLSFYLYYVFRPDGDMLHNGVIENIVYKYRINPNGITAKSLKSNRAIETYYITELCLREMQGFGVGYDQRAYEYFLRQCIMNWSRTHKLGKEVSEAVLISECELAEKYFKNMKTEDAKLQLIEQSLKERRFKQFELMAWSMI